MPLAKPTRLPHLFRFLHFFYHPARVWDIRGHSPIRCCHKCNSLCRYLLPGTIFAWRSPIEKIRRGKRADFCACNTVGIFFHPCVFRPPMPLAELAEGIPPQARAVGVAPRGTPPSCRTGSAISVTTIYHPIILINKVIVASTSIIQCNQVKGTTPPLLRSRNA